eukprot:11522386-Alexandrium_andersonii.AAC.1
MKCPPLAGSWERPDGGRARPRKRQAPQQEQTWHISWPPLKPGFRTAPEGPRVLNGSSGLPAGCKRVAS